MRISLIALLFLAVGFIHPVSMSFPALLGDVEGSGYDLDSSGSGSGDWSEQGEISNMKTRPSSKSLTSESTDWPAEDIKSNFVFVPNSKSFLENEQIFHGVIAGGVTGMLLAAILTALLIYKWQSKDNEGYIIGRRVHRDEFVV